MLPLILIAYSLIDAVALIFLFKQYIVLYKSNDYKNDSLINKFIVGFLAIGGMFFVLLMLILTMYFAIKEL